LLLYIENHAIVAWFRGADVLRKKLLMCKWKGVEIIEGAVRPDHIHLCLSIPPKMSVSSFIGYLKGKRLRVASNQTRGWQAKQKTHLCVASRERLCPKKKNRLLCEPNQ